MAHALQLGEPGIQVGHLTANGRQDVTTRTLAAIAQGKDLADLVQAEPEPLSRPDERNALGILGAIDPVAGLAAPRRRQNSDRFVVSDRLGIEPQVCG